MTTMHSRFPAALVAACALLLAACGGSSGGSAAPVGFLTADAQGLAGDTSQAGPTGAASPASTTDDTASAAGDLALAIEEADLYRVEGDRLLLLNAYRGLAIVDLQRHALIGRLAFVGTPIELYVRGQRALVLLTRFDGTGALLDVSLADPAAPQLHATLPLAGAPRTSRLIGERLVVVSDAGGASTVQSFALGTEVVATGSLELASAAEFAHATDSLLFLSSTLESSTRVTLVDISALDGTLAARGSIVFPGTIAADDRLHFAAGTFRIVTRDFTDHALSRLFTVDVSDPDAPHVRGTLELGYGEQLFATRFTEEKAYIVTFEQVDPLWIVDLADADHPLLAGQLTVPGWSSQLVALDDRLVALGSDPTDGWHVTVSLFDVSNPAAPSLRSRVDLGAGSSVGLRDRKAFSVFGDFGLVLVPVTGARTGLAVLDLTPSELSLRGWIETGEEALRGFPHTAGVCALTPTRVVIADPADLGARQEVIIADDVLDVGRLAPSGSTGGRIVTLRQEGERALLGNLALPLRPERLHPYGRSAAVTGYDDQGRAAYVADFSTQPPSVSPRIDLGRSDFGPWASGPGDIGLWVWPGAGGPRVDALVTPAGRLVVRGLDGGSPDLVLGEGQERDGFVVIDLPTGRVESRIVLRGVIATGAAIDGESLALTLARHGGLDYQARPLLRHDFLRLDLPTRAITAATNVPGALLALDGELVFTAEDLWDQGWSVRTNVVVSRLLDGRASVQDREPLPEGAFDLRVGGSTLYYATRTGYWIAAQAGAASAPLCPSTEIGTLRLAASLRPGPTIELGETFATLLLVEDSGALVVRNGVTVERFDVSGPVAQREWSTDVGIFPRTARADRPDGSYLLALGLGGVVRVP